MNKLLHVTVGAFFGVILLSGTAMAQSSISNTGPDSRNTITHNNSCNSNVRNNNNVNVSNSNSQNSSSGNVNNSRNTSSGSSSSGNASNSSSSSTTMNISNFSGGFCGGPAVAQAPAPAAPAQPSRPHVQSSVSSGRGAHRVQAAQVQAPVGAVRAGAPSDASLLLSLSSGTLFTGALAGLRIRKLFRG